MFIAPPSHPVARFGPALRSVDGLLGQVITIANGGLPIILSQLTQGQSIDEADQYAARVAAANFAAPGNVRPQDVTVTVLSGPADVSTALFGGQAYQIAVDVTDDAGTPPRRFVSNLLEADYLTPVFTAQPSFGQASFSIGATITLPLGTVTPNGTVQTVEILELDGQDKTGEISAGEWDTTGESAGTISYQLRATNGDQSVLSDLVTVDLTEVPTSAIAREGVGDDFFGASGFDLASSRTLSAVPVGAAAPGRRIYVGLTAIGANGMISGVTIDGVPMSLADIGQSVGEFGSAHAGFWTIDSDVIGGSVDIVVTGSSLREVAAQVWSSVGHTGLSVSSSDADSTSVSTPIDTFSDGAVLAVGQTLNAQPVTWSPAPGFVDQEIRSTDHFTVFEDLDTAAAIGTAYSFSTSQTDRKAICLLAINFGVVAPQITDFPDAAGEETVSYDRGSDVPLTVTVTVDGVQLSQAEVPVLADGEAFEQTPAQFTRTGNAPGDTVTAEFPHTHYHNIANFSRRGQWQLGATLLNNTTLSYDYIESQEELAFNFQGLNGGVAAITRDYIPPQVELPVITPTLTDINDVDVLTEQTGSLVSLRSNEPQWEEEDLSILNVVSSSFPTGSGLAPGGVLADGILLDTGATEGPWSVTVTVQHPSGGTATKTVSGDITAGTLLGVGTFQAEAMTNVGLYPHTFATEGPGGTPVTTLQNSPDADPGRFFGIWNGLAGLYDLTTYYRRDVHGINSAVTTERNGVLIGGVDPLPSDQNGFGAPYVISGQQLDPGDLLEWILDAQFDGAGEKCFTPVDRVQIAAASAGPVNYFVNPTDPTDPAGWSFNNGSTATAGQPDSDGGTTAILIEGFNDSGAARVNYAGLTIGQSYRFTATLKAIVLGGARHARLNLEDSNYFELDEGGPNGAPGTTGSASVTMTHTNNGFYDIGFTITATAESGVLGLQIAQADGSGVEVAGSFQVEELLLTDAA